MLDHFAVLVYYVAINQNFANYVTSFPTALL